MNIGDLPENIQEWLSSDQITGLVGKLNDRLNIPEGKKTIIPSLVYSVATNTVPLEEVKSILYTKFRFKEEAIEEIIKDVRDNILKPVESSLRGFGVDIQLLGEGRIPKRGTTPPLKTQEKSPSPTPVDLRSKSPKPPAPKEQQKSKEDKPFILHREAPRSEPPQQQSSKEPAAENKTEAAPNRVVHYSGPVTKVE